MFGKPFLNLQVSALRAHPVLTGIVPYTLIMSVRACLGVTAQNRSAAYHQAMGSFTTKSLQPSGSDMSFTREDSKEFHFLLNDKVVTGQSKWEVISYNPVTDNNGGQGCIITLAGDEETNRNLQQPASRYREEVLHRTLQE